MSEMRRTYDLLRAYVNREWERVKGIEESDAWHELQESLDPGYQARRAASGNPPRPTSPSTPASSDQIASEEDQIRLAYQILGVAEGSNFDVIRAAYERLNKRADPTRFPEGTVEQREASSLQRRVNIAYEKLAAKFPDSHRRFRDLELD